MPQTLMTGVVPHIAFPDAEEAIAFYTDVFGAEEMFRLPMNNGKLIHVHLRINGGDFMLCDQFPGCPELKASGITLNLDVSNADELFQKAIAAGAQENLPMEERFWGARYGQVVDPFGITWAFSTPVKDLSPQEIIDAGRAMASPT